MIQKITRPFANFFKLESASGLILLFTATIALVISNSSYSEIYFNTLQKYISLGIGSFSLKLSVIHWINDVLMTIFFFFSIFRNKKRDCSRRTIKSKASTATYNWCCGWNGCACCNLHNN